METVESCDLCGSQRQRHFEQYDVRDQTFTFVECVDCDLAFLNPRPTVEEMPRYYDEAYSNSHLAPGQSRFELFVAPLLRRFLTVRYGGSKLQSAGVRVLFFPGEILLRAYLRRHHLESLWHGGSVLDVGCGRGAWLSRMHRLGFECHGCEPDLMAAQIAQRAGLAVVTTDLPSAGYPDDSFDVVRFNNVLEHVHTPTLNLLEAQRILRPGGLVIIDSPNHAGIVAQSFRHAEDVPRHLYSFSPGTLRQYLEKVGLRAVRVTTQTRPLYTMYSQFRKHAGEMATAEGTPEKVALIERFLSFTSWRRYVEFLAMARFFDSIGFGSHVIAIGTKG